MSSRWLRSTYATTPPAPARLATTLIVLPLVVTLQVKAVAHASRPDLRAVEAIAVSSSLLVLPFASTYYAMDQAKSTSCDEPLTRTDAVYLAVTVFATVGCEVEATSQAARLVVTVQVVLDMIVIGVIMRVLLATVQHVGPSSTPPHSIASRRWKLTFIRSG